MESLRPGEPPEIGGYRLLARLGEGGMGEVFLARTASGRPLALKTVHRHLSQEPDFAERFTTEIRTNDRVRCPWTVSVVDFSPPGATPQWLATEYVAAPSLGDWVQGHGPLAGPALWSLARELSAALVTVREAGVVHRDIKPGNVLLGRERPYLIDFGIARAVRDPRRTRTGTVIGTPGFLAPEQASGAVAAAPADVFSLAAVLVYAATGRSPFLARGEQLDLPALLYRIVHDEPRLDGVPDALLPLVRDCLAKDPDRRPAAEEVRARLGAADGEDAWTEAASPALLAEVARREAALQDLLAAPGPQSPPAQPPIPAPVAPAAAPAVPAPPDTAPGTPLPLPSPGESGSRTGRASRTTLLTVAAVGAAALAVTVTLAVRFTGEGDGGSRGADGKASAPAATAATAPSASGSASTAALPQTWVGTWSGTGPGTPDADGITLARTGEFGVTVTLNAGAVGELVGRQVSEVKEVASGRNLGCTEALQLRQVRGATAVFEAVTSHPTDRGATFDCPRGNIYVLTMAEPDRVTLESEGAQSAGAPAALARHR
ncbi:serine/threonine-protein kinase [Streptomyces xanthophaeus]